MSEKPIPFHKAQQCRTENTAAPTPPSHQSKIREAAAGAVGSPFLVAALPLSGLPPSPGPNSARQTFPSACPNKIHYVKKDLN
jgi:hypothetical protein